MPNPAGNSHCTEKTYRTNQLTMLVGSGKEIFFWYVVQKIKNHMLLIYTKKPKLIHI